MQDVLLQYGIMGVVILGMAGFIRHIMKEHRKERDEWLTAIDKLLDKKDDNQKETNNIIRENSSILEGLKTLFEVHLRKEK